MKKKRPSLPVVPIALLALLCVAVAVFLITHNRSRQTSGQNELAAGMSYLESLEQKDPNTVVQIRKQRQEQKIQAQKDALIAQLENGSKDPFSMFNDAVVLGDSRTVGFWYYKFLDKSRVLADTGNTIRNIKSHMDEMAALNPATIYLCYGMNDLVSGLWSTKEAFAAEYLSIIQEVQAKLPNAKIVVCSILPARDPAFKKKPKLANAPEWNTALEQVCKDNKIIYVNCDPLAQSHADLWDVDGIHFRKAFYPYLATQMVVTALKEG